MQETLEKLLTKEIKFVVAIVIGVWGIAVPFFEIKQDIALIKSNHMTHMEMYGKELADLRTSMDKNEKLTLELMREIARK